jgi:hypothetical protein
MGTWLSTMALFIAGVNIPLHWVEVIFALEVLVQVFAIVFIAAIFLPPRNEHDSLPSDGGNKKGEYNHLLLDVEDVTDSGSSEESND